MQSLFGFPTKIPSHLRGQMKAPFPFPPQFNLTTLTNNKRTKKSNKQTKIHTHIHTYIDKYKHPPINTFCKANPLFVHLGGVGKEGGKIKILSSCSHFYI